LVIQALMNVGYMHTPYNYLDCSSKGPHFVQKELPLRIFWLRACVQMISIIVTWHVIVTVENFTYAFYFVIWTKLLTASNFIKTFLPCKTDMPDAHS